MRKNIFEKKIPPAHGEKGGRVAGLPRGRTRVAAEGLKSGTVVSRTGKSP